MDKNLPNQNMGLARTIPREKETLPEQREPQQKKDGSEPEVNEENTPKLNKNTGVNKVEISKMIPSLSIGWVFKNKFVKLLTFLTLFGAGIYLAFILLFLANLDTQFFKITIEGVVVNQETLEPIANAEVKTHNSVVTTDSNGYYKIQGLELGIEQITVSAEGFFESEFEIEISRKFNNYTSQFNFGLDSSLLASLEGRFVQSNPNFRFDQEFIYINNQAYNVNTDGTFKVDRLPVGEVLFEFRTVNFIDFDQNFELAPGLNTLEDINITPAGEIQDRFINYVTGEDITDVEIQVDNVRSDQIQIDSNGVFTISDLPIGDSYSLRFISPGILTRDYQVTIKQGLNPISNVRMVPETPIYFIQSQGRSNNQIFRTDIDGSNITQISNIINLNPSNLIVEDNEVFFNSTLGDIRSESRGLNSLIYRLDLDSGDIVTRFQAIERIGTLFSTPQIPNYVNIITADRGSKIELIQTLGENGQAIRTLEDIDKLGNITQAQTDENGEHVYLVTSERNNSQLYVNKTDRTFQIASAEILTIFDISRDGSFVLFEEGTSRGNKSLKLYNHDTRDTRVIKQIHTGKLYQFDETDEDLIWYIETLNRTNSIWRFRISSNNDSRLQSLQNSDNITSLYQQSGYLLYTSSNNGLCIIDKENPKAYVTIIK